jgi:hypothetical protein
MHTRGLTCTSQFSSGGWNGIRGHWVAVEQLRFATQLAVVNTAPQRGKNGKAVGWEESALAGCSLLR